MDCWEDLSLAVLVLVCHNATSVYGKRYHCGHGLEANRAPRAVDRRFTANWELDAMLMVELIGL